MNGVVVTDASALVALLTDAGEEGRWVGSRIARSRLLAAPALVLLEAANAIRRRAAQGRTSWERADLAHSSLLRLPIEQWSYGLLAERAWSHRENLTMYDASYVALAEHLGAPLVTLDHAIAGAPGLDCEVLTPPR